MFELLGEGVSLLLKTLSLALIDDRSARVVTHRVRLVHMFTYLKLINKRFYTQAPNGYLMVDPFDYRDITAMFIFEKLLILLNKYSEQRSI